METRCRAPSRAVKRKGATFSGLGPPGYTRSPLEPRAPQATEIRGPLGWWLHSLRSVSIASARCPLMMLNSRLPGASLLVPVREQSVQRAATGRLCSASFTIPPARPCRETGLWGHSSAGLTCPRAFSPAEWRLKRYPVHTARERWRRAAPSLSPWAPFSVGDPMTSAPALPWLLRAAAVLTWISGDAGVPGGLTVLILHVRGCGVLNLGPADSRGVIAMERH